MNVLDSTQNNDEFSTRVKQSSLAQATINQINDVSCRVPTDCSFLNRNWCSDVHDTCGECLTDYRGIIGISNNVARIKISINHFSYNLFHNFTKDLITRNVFSLLKDLVRVLFKQI